ncbi:MAG TPA: ABC transporter permease [Thermomicrobiales bacterium]|jgi:peptide/nickel transport system permease protein|nr:ABC transporter permease [Thermomicrobiales bacterium]
MLQYVIRRLLIMIPTLLAISLVAFIIIQLPPGDYLTTVITNAAARGETIDPAEVARLERQYGLDKPIVLQYFDWLGGLLVGDWGYSFEYNRPVSELIWERIGWSFVISLLSLLVVWFVAFPLGVFSAVRQHSWGDYITAFFGFIGLSTPDFLLALLLLYISFAWFNQSVGGLFSPEYIDAAWSLARFGDLLAHLWVPLVILGTNGIASMTRIMRANLLDELRKPYVTTARAKGLTEARLTMKYPVRIAVNPLVSSSGGLLAGLISGEAIVAVVLSLPTTGPMLLGALRAQDMYLAASFIMLLSVLTTIGVLLSDIALAWVDPRIRFG